MIFTITNHNVINYYYYGVTLKELIVVLMTPQLVKVAKKIWNNIGKFVVDVLMPYVTIVKIVKIVKNISIRLESIVKIEKYYSLFYKY